MKTILVLSDTHGNKEKAELIAKSIKYDYLIFLGDMLKDVENLNQPNVFKVKGNWDHSNQVKIVDFLNVYKVKIMFTHGHGYGVKLGLNKLINEAQIHNAQIVCYGHTHISDVSFIEGIWFVNPGALSTSKMGKNTYAVISICERDIKIDVKSY